MEDVNKTVANDDEINNDNVQAKQDSEASGTGEENSDKDPINDEMKKYKAAAEEYLQLLQRVQADFDNYRRRTTQEREEWSKYCSMRLATNLLPVLDNFERALQAAGDDINKFREGIELIYKQLKETLEKEGVKPINAVGSEFDPIYHEAVMQEPSDEYSDNVVIEELQKGYMYIDRVLRPSMVKVAKN